MTPSPPAITASPDPRNNVGDWPARHAAARGEADAVIDGDRSLDWRAFEGRVARTAGWLEARGIGPGERIAMLLGNRSATLEVCFAAARVGAIVVPMNLRLSPREIAFQIDDCTPSALFVECALSDVAARACGVAEHAPRERIIVGDPSGDAWEQTLAQAAPRHAVHPVTPDDPFMIMYTSGTTGEPKGALLPHRKALFNALNAEITFSLRPDDRVLVAAPLFHSLGLQILSLPALFAGAAVILHDRFEPTRVWHDVEQQHVSYLGGVPAMHQRLYDELERSADAARAARGLRFIFSAGSAISVELIRDFNRHDVLIMQGYGQTETSTLTCLAADDALRKAGSVGRPVEHAEVRVVCTDDLELAPTAWRDTEDGQRGEVVVRGDITMLGYWGRPDDTARTLIDGWLRTGDLASRDAEGFITLLGRAHDMYISGGENVYPAEVEAVFREHPSIEEVAIVGVPDERWGEVGSAHLVLHEAETVDAESLRAWAEERLAKYKVPQHFVVERDLPRTASGKVQKHRLSG